MDWGTWAESGKARRGAAGGRGTTWEGRMRRRTRDERQRWLCVKCEIRVGDKQETPLCWWLQPLPVCVPVALPSFLFYPGSPRRIPALIASAFVRVVSGCRRCHYPRVYFFSSPLARFWKCRTIERRQCHMFVDGCKTDWKGWSTTQSLQGDFYFFLRKPIEHFFIDLTEVKLFFGKKSIQLRLMLQLKMLCVLTVLAINQVD